MFVHVVESVLPVARPARRRLVVARPHGVVRVSALLGVLLGVVACGGTHAGIPRMTVLLPTRLADDADTVQRLAAAARAAGCELHRASEPTTRLLATCDDLEVLFAAGPANAQLSAQCAETRDAAECRGWVERLERGAGSAVAASSSSSAR